MKWTIKDKEKEKKCYDQIITRIDELDGEPAGVIAAQDIVQIVFDTLAYEIYNQALEDVRRTIASANDNLDVELSLLEKD